MKTEYTERYYRSVWDEMLSRKDSRNYMNLEEDLENLMKPYLEYDFPGVPQSCKEQAIVAIRKEIAKRVYNDAKNDLLKLKNTVVSLKSGKSCLGYTSEAQEIRERADLFKRFEFNCLQLADFRKKYNIQ